MDNIEVKKCCYLCDRLIIEEIEDPKEICYNCENFGDDTCQEMGMCEKYNTHTFICQGKEQNPFNAGCSEFVLKENLKVQNG